MIPLIKKLWLFSFLLIVLVGCSTTNTLKTPENLRYENGFLKWSLVDNAEHYVLDINTQTRLVYNDSFNLKDYPSGNYTVRIASFVNGKLSDYSEPINFQLIQNEVISEIHINDKYLILRVYTGLKYRVNVKETETGTLIKTEDLELNHFDYSTLADGLYDIEIILLLEETQVSTKTIRILKGDFTYVKDVGIVLDIEVPTSIYYKDKELEANIDYEIDEYGFILDSEVINDLDDNVNGFEITFKYDVDVLVYMDLVIIGKPEMVSSNSATYKGEDLSFEFDLKGGLFESLNGTDLQSDDYTFTGSVLTIKASYIERMIQKDPSATTVFLTFLMTNSPHVVFGFISIKLS